MAAYVPQPLFGFENQMLDINIYVLKDDESWRRLTALLLDSGVSDAWLEMMRARLMARLRLVSEEAANAPNLDTAL
jgi:hypothetical protein